MATTKAPRGTIAIEEAVLDPAGVSWMDSFATLLNPSLALKSTADPSKALVKDSYTPSLLNIHTARLSKIDAHCVEYMLLSLTSPEPQSQPNHAKAAKIASGANNWLAEQVFLNPARFESFASVSMHDAAEAAAEVFTTRDGAEGKKYYYAGEYRVFWKEVEQLDVPVYMHPRYPTEKDLEPGREYGHRRHLLGAAVQFHLDLSFHIYAVCSSGVFDEFPGVQLVIGHLGEGIPFNLWRADHWYNKPLNKATRPSKNNYGYYLRNNVSITTSGNFLTPGLKFCIEQLGLGRCLYSIHYPYDTIEEAQTWWRGVDLPEDQKEAVARRNAIRLFKLPLDP